MPFLVRFEFSREENDESTFERYDRLDCNIYRHPDLQGPSEERFTVLYDIDALAVVLHKIGLWRVAIRFEENYATLKPEKIMDSLQEHARDRLSHYMGKDYTDAVLACLRRSLLE
jgi:hypothetical protein